MLIGETLSRLLLKRLVDDVFVTGGARALDAIIDFLTRCGQQDDPRLTAALERAMQRAWRALEAALTGEPSWEHNQAGLAPRAAQELRRCLGCVLAELAHGRGVRNQAMTRLVANALRKRCLEDLCCARAGGALAGCVDREEWARSNETFVRFAANQGRRDTRRRTEGQLLRDLEEHGCVGLMRLLTSAGGLPLLLMAARAFLCQELAQLLYYCLQERPEQTPDNCTLVLEILQELSNPRFSIWRVPRRAGSVSDGMSAQRERAGSVSDGMTAVAYASGSLRTPHASWGLAAVLSIAASLLVVLPIWMLVETAQENEMKRQRAAEHQRVREERRRIEEEHLRLIAEQRRIVLEEAARQHALQRQREEAERRRLVEAEEERQRAEEQAAERLAEQRRRLAEEQRARLREEQRRREQARVALEDGLTHSALRRDREALTTLSEALRLDPNLPRAWGARGVVRRRLGDQAGALDDFHEAVRRDPRDVRSWWQCAELHAQRHENQQAIDAFTAVLRLEPGNVEAYRQRGLCYSRGNEVDKALADQTRAIELGPDDPRAYFYRAELQRLRNNLIRAFDDYTAAIDRARGNNRGLAGAFRGRGMLFLHWQRYDEAIQDLTQALALDPADSAAQRARGTAYGRIGDWNKTLLDAEALLRFHAGDNAAYKLRGQAFLGLEYYQQAHDDFTRALQGSRDAETYYLRARAKVHLGDIKEAIFDCNDATAINPQLADAFYLRGKLNLREGYRFSGLADCRTAHALDARFPMP
jgi:tetratricopeptide (TPR) repeat protein